MPEIGTSGLMSGDGKRGDGQRPKPPRPSSTLPDKLVALYIDVLNRAVAGRPADLVIGMHLCRGNMEGLWMGDGGYGPIAEALFAHADVDAFLLEYDSRRAGDFAPLRHLPAGKRAYLGIISTKNPALESPDDLMRRLEEAAQYGPVERLR